ncbi:MAG: glycine--tRNA ligase subunit beta, partial [Alphaproteobacteria bacterium]|nr:glycine--tRNA ligase subunit beta [Alphaproteobacteria bacterium]
MSDFLLEIFSEEIPAKMQKAASENFLQIAKESLSKNGLVFDELQIKVFVTPRRLVLYIYRLNHVQKMSAVKRVGPKISADQKAIEGFARSAGVKVTQLEESDGAYVFMRPESEIKTSEIIQKSLPQLLQKMTVAWPKLMRWNDGGARWIRPVRNIACLLGDELIECEFAGLQSNKLTFGRTSKPLPIPNAAHYEEILKDENIVLNQDLRRQKLMEQVHKIKFNLDLELVDDEKSALFDEIIGLCEWPVALVGSIEERFLNLPDEALILTLRNNQKYLCLKDKKGVLASKFIFVANALGNEQKIIADNENLVRARLSDVEFFIQEDLNKPLISRLDDLKKVVFHQKLGSVFERVNR